MLFGSEGLLHEASSTFHFQKSPPLDTLPSKGLHPHNTCLLFEERFPLLKHFPTRLNHKCSPVVSFIGQLFPQLPGHTTAPMLLDCQGGWPQLLKRPQLDFSSPRGLQNYQAWSLTSLFLFGFSNFTWVKLWILEWEIVSESENLASDHTWIKVAACLSRKYDCRSILALNFLCTVTAAVLSLV